MTPDFDVCRAARSMERFLPEYLDHLETLVNIDSGTFDKAGVDAVGRQLHSLYDALGVPLDVVPDAERGDNLIAHLAGRGRGRVLLLGHMDTVYAAGTAALRPFRQEQNRAIGPGTCDMKAGDLSIVYALQLLQEQNFDDFASIEIVHNSDEEIGSPGSKDLVRRHAERADGVLVLEAGRESGDIVSGRKGIASFELRVEGRSAHAGVNHGHGRSAALELAHLIVALEGLNGRVPGVTLNVGRIEAGGAVNVVPEAGFARFEARAFTTENLEEIIRLAQQVVARRTVSDTVAVLHHSIEHLPMHRSEATGKLVERAQILAEMLGFTVRDTITGGASDGNTAAAAGRPVLDGLGPIGGGAHSPREYVDVQSIVPRTALLAGLIASIGRGGLG